MTIDTPISEFLAAVTFAQLGLTAAAAVVLWFGCWMILTLRD